MMNYLNTIFFIVTIFVLSSNVHCNVDNGSVENDPSLRLIANLNDGDYEVVQFWHKDVETTDSHEKHLRLKRSDSKIAFVVKVGDETLIRENTPVWLVRGDNQIERVDDFIIKEAVRFFEEKDQLVKLYEYKTDKNGNSYFVGKIAKRSIQPLSEEAVEVLQKEKPHLFNHVSPPGSVEDDFLLSHYHIMYTPNEETDVDDSAPAHSDSQISAEYNRTVYDRLKRSVDTVYPELLVVVDYDQEYTSVREFRFLNLLTYVIRFWNAVNLRYSWLSQPAIKLRVTGIVVNMERRAIPYIRESIDTKSNMLDANSAITKLKSWANSQTVKAMIPSDGYDIIMTMTNKQLCSVDSKTKECKQDGLLGLAWTKAECQSWRAFMGGILHETMDYNGIGTAAHELGHVLGAEHDEKTSKTSCRDTNGFIMSWSAAYRDREFWFSQCSKDQFSKHLRSKAISCLLNREPVHDQGKDVPELLPGSNLSVEAQCDRLGYGVVCEANNVCRNLVCRHTLWFCESMGVPAIDGTPCGENAVCKTGYCTQDLHATHGNPADLSQATVTEVGKDEWNAGGNSNTPTSSEAPIWQNGDDEEEATVIEVGRGDWNNINN